MSLSTLALMYDLENETEIRTCVGFKTRIKNVL